MQNAPAKVSRSGFVAAIAAVALGLMAITGIALYTKAPSGQATFNTEIANAIKVDSTNSGHRLAFNFDLAWQPSYSGVVCLGKEGDERLTQPKWNTFREEMNRQKSETIGLAMRPWGDGTVVALLTVRLGSSGASAAQDDARETIEILRRYSPCVR